MPQLKNFKRFSKVALLSMVMGMINVAHAQSIIKIDGSSTVYPISKAAAVKFAATKKNPPQVNISISGSGGGFTKFCRGEIDIVNASRPILKNEITECKNSGVQYIEIPIAFDALTVVVNPENNWVNTLTIAELKKIWEPAAESKIIRWNQINPTWPDEVFRLYGADADSGTFDYFTKAIIGKAKTSRKDFTESENDNVLVQGVASNKHGLGFFGFAYYIENESKVKAVAIDNGKGEGGILPSVETVENGSYQPLSRPIFMYVNVKAIENLEIKGFIEFYLKNALLVVKEARFFPLPPRAYTTMLEHLNKKRVGTLFNGMSAIGLTIDELIRRGGRLEYDNY